MTKKALTITVISLISLNAFAGSLFFNNKTINMEDGGNSSFVGGMSGSCTWVPASALAAYKKAKKFSETCAAAALAPGKVIAINDYSAAKPTMYVFKQDGSCVDSMSIDWGRGPGPRDSADRKITSCAAGGSYRTPAGMHKTTYHNGSLWPASISLGMAGLNGQNSYGPPKDRAILIHPSRAGENAGGPYSIGCTGVPASKFKSLQRTLGYGSLVYNYFGEESRKGAGCSDNRGGDSDLRCGPADRVTGSTGAALKSGRSGQSAEPTARSGGSRSRNKSQQGTN